MLFAPAAAKDSVRVVMTMGTVNVVVAGPLSVMLISLSSTGLISRILFIKVVFPEPK